MNVSLRAAAADFPRRAFTVEDVRRMVEAGVLDENERIELIEGELVMIAAKGYAHELVKTRLLRALVRAAPDDVEVTVEATLRLTDNTLLEPDIAVVPSEMFAKPVSGFLQLDPGQAKLVVEVAASSLSYDKGLKSKLYARHGVQEFWVIDANTRMTWVHTGPQEEGWASIVEHDANSTLTTTAVSGFSIRLADIG